MCSVGSGTKPPPATQGCSLRGVTFPASGVSVKEKIILLLVKMARKALSQSTAIRERNRAQLQVTEGQVGIRSQRAE